MNFELLFASSNTHKVNEVRKILSPHGITLYGINDLNLDPGEIIEDGDSYFENAKIKAIALAKITNMPIIADDSGLEVEALDNAPGLYSSRFAKEFASQEEANRFVVNKVQEVGNNKAAFICDIVLVNTEDKPLLFEGKCEGIITDSLKGVNGFGYDPIFVPNGYESTFAELDEDTKNKISHRARALTKLLMYLRINGYIKK